MAFPAREQPLQYATSGLYAPPYFATIGILVLAILSSGCIRFCFSSRWHKSGRNIVALILMIDDDASVRRMTRRILEAAGHEVVEANDGSQGLKLFAELDPQLVITDIVMPDKEGIGTILDIRRTNKTVGIIAVSGGGVDIGLGYLKVATRAGATAALAKPFMAAELTDVVESVLKDNATCRPDPSVERGPQ